MEIDELVLTELPLVASSLLDHEGVKDFLPPSGLGTEDRNIRVKTESTGERTNGKEDIGKDVGELVASLEDTETK